MISHLKCLPQGQDDLVGQVHIHGAENVAVMVAGLQVLGDVGKGTEVLRVLRGAGNVPDLMLGDDILPGKACSGDPAFLRACPTPFF